MDANDFSRNHTARPGYQLQDAIDLPGWEDQSVWGWDDGGGSFYAQLWRNGSTSDAPEIWLSGASTPYPWPGSIALEIVEQTHALPLAVVHAMAISHPAPALRPESEIEGLVSELMAMNDGDPYSTSKIRALAWVLGTSPLSPGSHTAWTVKPSPAQVDAEHHLVTGHIYRRTDGGAYAGADEALWWALGR